MKMTVKQFAEAEGIHQVEAAAILKFLEKRNFAKRTEISTGQRGRPTHLYSMPQAGKLRIPVA